MKRKAFVLYGIVIAGVTLLMIQVKSGSANNTNFMELLLSQTNSLQTGQSSQASTVPPVTIFSEGMEGVPTEENIVTSINFEQVKKNEAILESARTLIEKANTVYRSGGWWHSTFQNYLIPSNPEDASLPNGLPMPTEWKEDHWALVDKNGFVIEEVSIQDTSSPETAQIGIFKDGIMTNVTFEITWKQEPYIAPLDGGFLAVAETDQNMAVLDAKEDMLNEAPVTVYTSTTTSAKPIDFQKGYLVAGGINKYYFSKDTGFLLLFEHYDVLADGQTQLTQRIATLVVEKVSEPPIDVLKYLDR
jgi:hypothetical protein